MEYCNIVVWEYSRQKVDEYFQPKKEFMENPKNGDVFHIIDEFDSYPEYIICNDGILRQFDGIENEFIPEEKVYLMDIVHSTPWLNHEISETGVDGIFIFDGYDDFLKFAEDCKMNKYDEFNGWPNETLVKVKVESVKSYCYDYNCYEYDTESEVIGVVKE